MRTDGVDWRDIKMKIRTYQNKRNKRKYIEVHNDGHHHNSVRQYIQHDQKIAGHKVGVVRNYTGDGKLHRWRKGNLNELLEDYKEV
jgi:hypothetical protein